MSDRITEKEYWAEVRSTAESIFEEVREDEGIDTEPDDLRDPLGDRLRETIDGHEWVVYTWKAQQILSISPNDAYSIEEFGCEQVVQDGTLNWSALAFGALYADVSDVLWQLHSDWEDELEEDAEEDDQNPETPNPKDN